MNEHDDLTTTLTRELHGQVDTMTSALGFGDVQRRARSIRRRRTTTALAGAVAAVGVIASATTLVGHGGGRPEPGPSTQLPSPSATTTTTGHQPAPGVLDVSDLPTGAAPLAEYVTDGSTLHRVDGSTVDVGTTYPISSFVVLGDGSRVWQTVDNGHPYVEVQDADGNLQQPVRSTWGLTVSRSHDAAAWAGPDGQVMEWTAGATQPRAVGDPITAGHDLRMGPFENDSCTQRYCTVYVNVADAQTASGWQVWEVTVSDSHPYLDGSYLSLTDIGRSGYYIGYAELTEVGSCSRLQGGGEFVGWSTCQHTLVSFSPDGRTVLGDPAYHDGVGNGSIAMYGADRGNLLFERHSTAKSQSFYPDETWEDDTHVLAPVSQGGRWSVVRIASDGTMEYAVPPVDDKGVESPFVLPTGGMPSGG